MSDPDVAVSYLAERYMRKADRAPSGLIDLSTAALDTLYEVVVAKLGEDSVLKQLEAEASQLWRPTDATLAQLRLALREAADRDPGFRDDLKAALAIVRQGSVTHWGKLGGANGGAGAGAPGGTGMGGGVGQYAVEDVWVDEKEQADPPEPGESPPRTLPG